MLISLIVGIISQCLHVSERLVVHFNCLQFLFVSYTSIKLKKISLRSQEIMESRAAWRALPWKRGRKGISLAWRDEGCDVRM